MHKPACAGANDHQPPLRQGPRSHLGSGLEHLLGENRLSVGDAQLMGLLVRHGQEAADTAGNGVLGQLRVGELPELLQGRLLMRDTQAAGLKQVGGDIVPQDLEGALDPGP